MRRASKIALASGIGLLILVVAIVAWRATHQNGRDNGTPPKLKLGVATWIGYGIVYIAQEKGFFDGADIELRRIDDTAVFNAAMLKGDIDACCTTLDTFALASATGVEGKVVYIFDESAGADGIVAKPAVKSFADLKGRKIAAQTGWPGHFFMLYLTKEGGLKAGDYTHINLDSDKAGAAFMSGNLDAAVTWEPWLSKIRTSGEGHILANSKDHPGVLVDALIIRPNALASKEKEVQILVDACLKGMEYWKAHPDESNRIVAKHFDLSETEVGEMIKGVRFLDRTANREYLRPDGQVEKTLRMASSIWLEAKVIERMPELKGVVANKYVR